MVKAFTDGNVAVSQLDGNDLSAELSDNNGYTGGLQTSWLEQQLASYRAPGSGVDFIVAGFHNMVYSSNTTHGSDGGIRLVWGPLFDRYQVDLVVSGHVHAYERSYPVVGSAVTKVVPSGIGCASCGVVGIRSRSTCSSARSYSCRSRVQIGQVVTGRHSSLPRIVVVVSRDDAEQQCGLGHRGGHDAGMIDDRVERMMRL